MKTFLAITLTLSLVTPTFAKPHASSDIKRSKLSAQAVLAPTRTIVPSNKSTPFAVTAATNTLVFQESSPQTLALTTSVSANPITSQKPSDQTIIATQESSTNNETIQNFPHVATTALYTLTSIFNALVFLLQNTSNLQNVAQSLNSILSNVFTLIAQTSGKKGAELETFMDDLKKDCNQSLHESMGTLETAQDADYYKRPSKNEEKEAKAQAAIYNVATIATGVANIVQNPHDKVNVGQSVGAILAGIINIAMLASHKPRQQVIAQYQDLIENAPLSITQ